MLFRSGAASHAAVVFFICSDVLSCRETQRGRRGFLLSSGGSRKSRLCGKCAILPIHFRLSHLASTSALKQVLRPVHLWAIAVGLVISGEYFGWNYGWGVAGTVGFLLATLLVTVLYVTFIFSFTELTAAIPQAGGPFAYAYRAFGPLGGFVAGDATLVEFLLAPPAIALALGS